MESDNENYNVESIEESMVFENLEIEVNSYDDLISYSPESSGKDEFNLISNQEPYRISENLEIEANNNEDLLSLISYSESSDEEEFNPLSCQAPSRSSENLQIDDMQESSEEDEFNGSSPQPSIHEIEDVYEGRPKRGRKRKIPGQSRADRKRLLNTNKTHINSIGDIYLEKIFDEKYECQCSQNCTELIDIEDRRRLFTQFWAMGTFEGRCAFLMSCVTQKSKKRTYTKNQRKNRLMTRQYSIYGIKVCKKALLRTLQISDSRVNTAFRKQMYYETYEDYRGKLSGGANALPPSKIAEVRAHIASFPKYVSHYTRAQTDSKYLNADLNLAKIYKIYKNDTENPVSKSVYKRIFYKYFNLKFKKPKKDTCLKCDIYLAKIKAATGAEVQLIEEWHNAHLEQADSFQDQMKADLEDAKNDDELETLPYDMQKTMSLPKLPTSIVYYKRQLNLNNFGIHAGSTGKGIFNLWPEYVASKGTQEVGSCLKKHIDSISKPIKKLILWSDSCGGQNRSIKIVLMMMFILQNHRTLESISLRYLQSGHSFLPNDTEFGDAECALKQHERLCTDQEYMNVMKECRSENTFEVNSISPDVFLSVNKLEKLITNRKKDINNKKISWLDTHEILIEKNQLNIIKMRKNFVGVFQSVNLAKRGCKLDFKNIVLDKLWPNGHPISKEKIKDLQDMLQLVDKEHHHFYDFIKTVPSVDFIDDVDGFGEFIDFEVEH